jgi:hypothetical protein
LKQQSPSIVLAMALAEVGDKPGALEVVKQIDPVGRMDNRRGELRRFELELRELANVLEMDVTEFELANPWLETWVARPYASKAKKASASE